MRETLVILEWSEVGRGSTYCSLMFLVRRTILSYESRQLAEALSIALTHHRIEKHANAGAGTAVHSAVEVLTELCQQTENFHGGVYMRRHWKTTKLCTAFCELSLSVGAHTRQSINICIYFRKTNPHEN